MPAVKRDPIELELFRHLLVSIAEEMGAVLRKPSYSANIKMRLAYSCAVYAELAPTSRTLRPSPLYSSKADASPRSTWRTARITPTWAV